MKSEADPTRIQTRRGGMMFFEIRCRRFVFLALVLAGWVGWFAMSPAVAEAELQKVEAVGSYGIREGTRNKVIPRDEAVQNAIWEGVSRVAHEVVGALSTASAPEQIEPVDPGEATSEGDASILREVLGRDMLPYTRSFRIVRDRGENPVLFAEDPQVQVEYIVVVEMLVDVGRVKAALAKAGLISIGEARSMGAPIFVELVGAAQYRDFEAIRSALVADIGATRVDQLGFARKQQLLSVVGPFGPRELSSAMARLDGKGWSLEPVGVDEEHRRIRLRGHHEEPITSD